MEKDVLEFASDLTHNWIEANANAVRELVPEPKESLSADDLICDQCGGEIAEGRAARGYTVCIDCQREIDRVSKRYRVPKRYLED